MFFFINQCAYLDTYFPCFQTRNRFCNEIPTFELKLTFPKQNFLFLQVPDALGVWIE